MSHENRFRCLFQLWVPFDAPHQLQRLGDIGAARDRIEEPRGVPVQLAPQGSQLRRCQLAWVGPRMDVTRLATAKKRVVLTQIVEAA